MHNGLYRLLKTHANTLKSTYSSSSKNLTPADFAEAFFYDQSDFHNLMYSCII